MRTVEKTLYGIFAAAPYLIAAAILFFAFSACMRVKPQQGGRAITSLGGGATPTQASFAAPENPQTPSRQTIERTTTREFSAASPSAGEAAPESGGVTDDKAPAPAPAGHMVREHIAERVTTELGSSWRDTARELGARLTNMRGVMWTGVALMILGPVAGWKMGWLLNGLIAGGVGLLLVILATVIPGNEAWFGLGGLLLIPLVAYVYYKSQYDANKDGIPDRLQRHLRDINPPASS